MASNALTLTSGMTLQQLGNMCSSSGFFADSRDAAQAAVKIQAGAEIGFPPIASMVGVYIVKGRVSLSANLMAAAIKRYEGGKYNYRIREHTDKVCSIEFFERNESLGVSTFTIEDGRRAGTQNLDKFPRNMLFARAMSNGAKWHCADVFAGPVYTPEELGEEVDEEGDMKAPPKSPPPRLVAATPVADSTPAPAAPSPKRRFWGLVGQWTGMQDDADKRDACILVINREKLGGVELSDDNYRHLIGVVEKELAAGTDYLEYAKTVQVEAVPEEPKPTPAQRLKATKPKAEPAGIPPDPSIPF